MKYRATQQRERGSFMQRIHRKKGGRVVESSGWLNAQWRQSLEQCEILSGSGME